MSSVQAPRPPVPAPNQPAPVAAPNTVHDNYQYLRSTLRKRVVCPPSSGAGLNQTFAGSTQLNYDVPTVQGGYLDSLLFKCAITVNPATGTGATYAANFGVPFTAIQYIQLQFGKQQVRVRPITLKYLPLLFGYVRSLYPQILTGGLSNAWLQPLVWGSPFNITTNTNNAWTFWFRLPLRLLPRSAAGMIPMMAQSTVAQVQIVTATLLGPDPLDNPIATTGGTGAAVTGGGTIQVLAEYRDGTNYMSPSPLALDLTGQPTIQWYIDRPINPLTSGSVLRQKIDNKLQHLFALSYVVDGQQSTTLISSNSNIAELETDMDSGGANRFLAFGTQGNNLQVADFFEEFRYTFGQDLDHGLVPWIPGPSYLGLNPDNQEGGSFLNMMGGGWTDFNYGLQVTTTSTATAGLVPRVETQVISVNPAGLVMG